jgi:hypothetical protein
MDHPLKTYRRGSHCRAGHPMVDDNVHWRADTGSPQCKTCQQTYRDRYLKKKLRDSENQTGIQLEMPA